LATAAGVFIADMPDYLDLRWENVQLLGDDFANFDQ
jgi:hypothetical protein